MKLFIDVHEPEKIKSSLKHISLIKRLEYGDFMFTDNENYIIIERKTMKDMSASIKDNRSKRQSSYLSTLKTHSNVYIYYLIEKCKLNWKFDMNEDTVWQSIVNKQFHYGFEIIYTDSVDDTIKYIEKIHKCIMKYGIKHEDVDKKYTLNKTIKSTEFKKLKDAKPLLKMLRGIVPYNTAKAISDKYMNITDLCNHLYKNPSVLIGLQISSKRRIGKVTCKKIYDACFT
jgi:ERCC4-type nuclease